MGRAKNSQSVEHNVDDGAKSGFRTLGEGGGGGGYTHRKGETSLCLRIAAESPPSKPSDTYLARYQRRLHGRFKFLAVTFLGVQSAQLPDPR